jgi:hypothetical protein
MYTTQQHTSQIELQEYRLADWLNDVFDLPLAYGIGEDVVTICWEMSFISLNSYRTLDFVCPNCKTSVLINTNFRQQQGRANPFHELVKFGFRFSAKAAMPTR